MKHQCSVSEAKAWKTRVFGVREFVKESRVPAHEAKNRDGETQKLLPVGDGV